jgi:recombination protein RecA
MKKKSGKKIIREVAPKSRIDAYAKAVASVLGSDAVHRGSDSDLGVPRTFIPSGVPELDKVLDREGRGWPGGRIVEIFGAEATAKTAVGYALIAQAQKLGGSAIIYPSEGNYDEWLAQRYNIDESNLILGDDNTVEGIFSSWRKAIKVAGKDGLLIGMIDSIAGISTQAELDEPVLKRDRHAQIRAQMISSSLRRMGAEIPRTSSILFCVNQVRENPDVLYGEKRKPPGGMALKFYASIRLKLESLGKITREQKGKKYTAGFKLRITAVKNRLAKPYQQADFILDYEKGLLPLSKKKRKRDVGQ